MSKVIGIDLGTCNSCFSIFEGGTAKVITNAEGNRTTPSIVAWTKTGERIVGQAAKRQAITNPESTVYEVKRLIGRKFSEVKDEVKHFPFTVIEAPNGDCRIKINGKDYSPEEISSFVLAKIKADAEAYLGESVTEAVITVPAYFNDSQRQSTKDAAKIAGLNVLRIINEPTAASLAYGMDKNKSGYIAVFDSGAGTFDISILEIGDGVFEVKATNGNTQLGGKDYDQKIIDWLVSEFKTETGIDLRNDKMACQRLKDEAEKAKISLSTAIETEINLPFITADASGPKHLVRTLSRAKFESLIADLNEKYVAPCKQAIADSGVKVSNVILVGGTTRIPSVQEKVKEIFGVEPNKDVNPDEAVSMGAAIQAGVLKGDVKDILLLDVTPLSLSICVNGNIAKHMIEKNTTIPVKKTDTFTTAIDNQPACTIQICQGERPMFNDNKLLGQFNIDGIPPAPRGVPQIEITYDIDANGILTVSAKDKGTGKENHITITSSSGMSKEEIDKAIKEAEAHADEDKKKLELSETKNLAETLCFALEKTCNENKDKLGDDVIKEVTDSISSTREAISTNDIDKIKSAYEALNKLNAEKVVPKIYVQSSGTPPGNMPTNNPSTAETTSDQKSDDGTVDAEVV